MVAAINGSVWPGGPCAHFCPDDPSWKEAVLFRGRKVLREALSGFQQIEEDGFAFPHEGRLRMSPRQGGLS